MKIPGLLLVFSGIFFALSLSFIFAKCSRNYCKMLFFLCFICRVFKIHLFLHVKRPISLLLPS